MGEHAATDDPAGAADGSSHVDEPHTGSLGSRLGQAPARPPVLRNVIVGLLAMGMTSIIGTLVGGAL